MKSRSSRDAIQNERRAHRQLVARSRVRSRCYFCEKKILIRFLTKRGKIRPRTRSGLCARHQRTIAKEIKRGRNLGLLPFRIVA